MKEHSKNEENEKPRRTLFVRNLPFSTTNQKLEDEFSQYGPIKNAFIVKDKDNGSRCRGFGYVQFVLQDDADKAASSQIKMDDRALKISYAMKKPKHEKRKANDPTTDNVVEEEISQEKETAPIKKQRKKKIQTPSRTADYKHPTTNQTQNQIDTQLQRTVVLTGLTSKVKRKAFRILCEKFGEIENIVYPVPERNDVTAFVRFKDVKGAVRASQKISGQKVRKSNILSAVLLNKEGKPKSKKVLQKARIIIRNMSFKCEEQDLSDCFSKFGKILHIHIPTKTVGEKVVKVGLAFIQFDNPKNAEMAIKEMNLKKIKERPVVVDWAIDKELYNKEKAEQGEQSTDDKTHEKKRKKLTNKLKKKDNEKSNDIGSDVESNDENDDKSDNESDNENDESDEEDLESDAGEDNDMDDDTNESESEHENEVLNEKKLKKKVQLKDAKEGRTVFIRNLPYEVEEETLTEEFEKFGEIEFCKIVVDHATGRSKGSAFLKFKDKEHAEKCVADITSREEKGSSLTIEGRPIKISIAVTQGKVMEIERKKNEEAKETDKRNLSLAYEGVITGNTPGSENLSESDLKKREKALEEKKKKLKDPNYFVSKTRLCFRNLPLNVDKKMLQNVLIKQIPDLQIANIRIMRNKERKDSQGVPRSLGFGFVELSRHDQALKLLRMTNNNPAIFGEDRRPIVDFSVESLKALKILEARKSTIVGDNTNADSKKRKFHERKRKRIEKFQLRREERRKGLNEKESIPANTIEKKPNKNYPISKSVAKSFETKKSKSLRSNDVETKTQDSKQDSKTTNRKRKDSDPINMKRPKSKKHAEEEKFKGLVDSYKKRILGNDSEGKIKETRWYE